MGCCQSTREIKAPKRALSDPYRSMRTRQSELFVEPEMNGRSGVKNAIVNHRSTDSYIDRVDDLCDKMGVRMSHDTQIYSEDASEITETIEEPQTESEEEEEEEDKDRYVIEQIILDPAQVETPRNVLSAGEEEEEEVEIEQVDYSFAKAYGEDDENLELDEMQIEQIERLPSCDPILISMVKRRNTLRKQIVLEPILTKEILEKGLRTERDAY